MNIRKNQLLKSFISLLLLLLSVIAMKIGYQFLPSPTPAKEISEGKKPDRTLFNIIKSGNLIALDNYLKTHGGVNSPMDDSGWSPLMLAACRADYEMVRFLIRKGADVNFKNDTGDTALILVAVGDHDFDEKLKIARLLIYHGADVKARNSLGETAVFLAERNKNVELLKLLKESEH